ncbi:MAG: hypothetical protein AB8F26_05635 [Phycisphaerales bacterium]
MTTHSPSPGTRLKVPWFGRWGVFGISWFAMVAILVPLVLVPLLMQESHVAEFADTKPRAHVVGYMLVGTVLFLLVILIPAIFCGFVSYLVTTRRWFTPPTLVFLLVLLLLTAGVGWGIQQRTGRQIAANEALEQMHTINRENIESARRGIETDGDAMLDLEDSQRAVEGLRNAAEASVDPDEQAVLRIGADLGDRMNEYLAAYSLAVDPFLETGATDVENDITEDELLERIEMVERSMEKNGEFIGFVDRVPAILKIEFANKTSLNPKSRADAVASFLGGMHYEEVVTVRESEQRILAASREQLMVLLDTFGLWVNTPDGFEFYDSIDDTYIERFNAAFSEIQLAAAEQVAAQERMFGATAPAELTPSEQP